MTIIWIDFPDRRFEVCGLPFFMENSPDLYRFPKSAHSHRLFEAAKQPCGGRIRFATDSTELHIRLRYSNLIPMLNMCRFGQAGVDVCVDGEFWNIISPASDGTAEYMIFSGVTKKLRQVCLYLPLYHPVEVLAIGFDEHAEIANASQYRNTKPIVFYGSSITQGGCASRPSLSYQAIMCKQMNLDFVNFGFSGQGKGEPEVADIVSSVQASCYVMDFAVNIPTAGELEKVYYPFLEKIRLPNPETPIICITPVFNTAEFYSASLREKHAGQRQVIGDAVALFNSKTHNKIRLVEGTDLLGPLCSNAFVDGCHPNDLGFLEMAKNLAPILSETIGWQ